MRHGYEDTLRAAVARGDGNLSSPLPVPGRPTPEPASAADVKHEYHVSVVAGFEKTVAKAITKAVHYERLYEAEHEINKDLLARIEELKRCKSELVAKNWALRPDRDQNCALRSAAAVCPALTQPEAPAIVGWPVVPCTQGTRRRRLRSPSEDVRHQAGRR